MEETITKLNLTDSEKELLKSISKEILDLEIKQEKDKGKEHLEQEEINKEIENNYYLLFNFIKIFKIKKEFTKEEVEKQFNKIIGIQDKETSIIFQVYLGDEFNFKDYKIFSDRLRIIKFLEKNNIIKISKINVFEMYKEIKEVFPLIENKILDIKALIGINHPQYIKDIQIEKLVKLKDNYLKIIIFEKEKVEKLYYSLNLNNQITKGDILYLPETKEIYYFGNAIHKFETQKNKINKLQIFFEKMFKFEIGQNINFKTFYYLYSNQDDYYQNTNNKAINKRIINLIGKANKLIKEKSKNKSLKLFAQEKDDNNHFITRLF